MPRQKRIDYPGAWHHVMNRGARKAPIFRVRADCQGFLDFLEETVAEFEIELHAYSLMLNHYHLLVRSRLGNLSKAMQHLIGNYTQWLNKRHRWDGPVFRGRFRSQLVEDEEHLRVLVPYIHLNPVVAGLLKRVDADGGWTSYRAYMNKEPRPEWLTTSLFIRLFGGRKRLHSFVQAYRTGRKEYPEDFNPDTGLFGNKAIEKGASRRKKSSKKEGTGPRNQPVKNVLQRVHKLTGASMHKLRRKERGPGANPARRFAVWALNRGTSSTHREIAATLNMSYHQVGRVLSQLRKYKPTDPIRGWMDTWVAQEEGSDPDT